MQIKGIKLTTGDELVAKVLAENADGSLVVEDALMLAMQMTKDGMVCNFYPWTIINEGNITLQAIGIMAHYPVPKDVEQSYTQNTSSLQIVSGAAAKQILHG